MAKPKSSVGRRGFLKGAAAGAAGFVAAPLAAAQQEQRPDSPAEVTGNEKPGSDFMVDVLKTLGIEYCAANPGSSFRGLQESFINYGGNKSPEWLTCCHEESVGGHGARLRQDRRQADDDHGAWHCRPSARVDGDLQRLCRSRADVHRPRQHSRRQFPPRQRGVGAQRSGCASMVRDFIKWDDTPVSLGHFAESAVRAYKIAMTPPYEPVVIVADGALAGRADHRQEPAHSQARDERASAGRLRCRSGSGPNAGRRRESCDRGGTRRAHAEGRRTSGRVGGSAAGHGQRSAHADELPVAHPLYGIPA